MWMTREQGIRLVRQWCAPHLWLDREHSMHRLFDTYETLTRLDIANDPLQVYPDCWALHDNEDIPMILLHPLFGVQ
jgi:hypothetical protein